MQYCPRCRRLCADKCPGCGRTRGLRLPEPTDPVRLIAADFMQAMLIEPVLEQNGVAYAKAGQMGEGLKLCAARLSPRRFNTASRLSSDSILQSMTASANWKQGFLYR